MRGILAGKNIVLFFDLIFTEFISVKNYKWEMSTVLWSDYKHLKLLTFGTLLHMLKRPGEMMLPIVLKRE